MSVEARRSGVVAALLALSERDAAIFRSGESYGATTTGWADDACIASRIADVDVVHPPLSRADVLRLAADIADEAYDSWRQETGERLRELAKMEVA